MALNDPIITISDVRQYEDVDQNYSSERFSGFLKQIQNNNLRKLLGAELWLDFFENISDSKYTTLISGENYSYNGETIYYPGLKPFLVFNMLTKIIVGGDVFHTNRGNFKYNPETAQPIEKYQLQEKKTDYLTTEKFYENEIIKYLNEKSSTYTLWNGKSQSNETDFTFKIV
ncbi:MAG: DUF6712 family protein [Candidatus Hodarchaeales archaeon]|jgi:hypothetical protein